MGWVVISTTRSLYPRERDAVAIVQKADRVPGHVWTDAENLFPTGIRSTDRPVRSESLYRLCAYIMYVVPLIVILGPK